MKDVIEVWVIKDPNGDVWKTPKGKSSWASQCAAKNAWGGYYLKLRETKCDSKYSHQLKWPEDAQGWSFECVAKYDLVKRKHNE